VRGLPGGTAPSCSVRQRAGGRGGSAVERAPLRGSVGRRACPRRATSARPIRRDSVALGPARPRTPTGTEFSGRRRALGLRAAWHRADSSPDGRGWRVGYVHVSDGPRKSTRRPFLLSDGRSVGGAFGANAVANGNRIGPGSTGGQSYRVIGHSGAGQGGAGHVKCHALRCGAVGRAA